MEESNFQLFCWPACVTSNLLQKLIYLWDITKINGVQQSHTKHNSHAAMEDWNLDVQPQILTQKFKLVLEGYHGPKNVSSVLLLESNTWKKTNLNNYLYLLG